MEQNLSDPVIDEIREVRHRISARFAHDPTQLVAYYTLHGQSLNFFEGLKVERQQRTQCLFVRRLGIC